MHCHGRIVAIASLVFAALLHASGCGSEARGVDACRQIESARCEAASKCPTEFPEFTERYGSVASCQRFYDVQCGRGVQEASKEPSRAELTACLTQVRTSCEAAADPAKFCPFLTVNEEPVVIDDTGAPAEDAIADTELVDSELAETD
jgi:hypothetical protein